MKERKIDDNTIELYNDTVSSVGYYEFRGTPFERQIVIKPGEKVLVNLVNEDKVERKISASRTRTAVKNEGE